jgi:hypothetical protein
MAAKVLISYRRNDSAGHVGRVHDRLEREFGSDLLVMDVDAIPLGVNSEPTGHPIGDGGGRAWVAMVIRSDRSTGIVGGLILRSADRGSRR